MSKTKFDLKFPYSKGGLSVKIVIGKAFDPKAGFLQGIEGRQVKTVKVLARDDVKPLERDDIERLIPWTSVESYYPYKQPDGTVKLLPIDVNTIKKIYQNSSTMSVISIVPMGSIKPSMYDGSHYFVRVQKESKSKILSADDQKIYTILYYGLLEKDNGILVKYISYNREKFAILYADHESKGLMMAHILHSTYQRSAPAPHLIKMGDPVKYSNALFKDLHESYVSPETIEDTYEAKIKSHIARLEIESSSSSKSKSKISLKMKPECVTTEPDILDQILSFT